MISTGTCVMERSCLECGEALKGRSDKKFCDDQCRSSHNNRVNGEVTAAVRLINNALRRNRRILHHLYRERGLKAASRLLLLEMGFNFSFCTHLQRSGHETFCRWCYEYGYHERDEDWLELVESASDPEFCMVAGMTHSLPVAGSTASQSGPMSARRRSA